jgi:Ca-activated chloride channel homolog
VSITDLMNRPVTGLEKENFKVFEGKELQDIRHFSGEDIPVSLGVILDTSGSMSTKIDRAHEAVVQFFKTVSQSNRSRSQSRRGNRRNLWLKYKRQK